MNTEIVAQDLEILTTEGNIGFYTRCEVTEIFIHSKKNKKVYNLLTLLAFEDATESNDNKYLTENGLIQIKGCPDYKFGINRYYTSIQDAKQHFLSFLKSKNWSLSGKKLNLSEDLTFLPKQFVPADGNLIVPLNSILKNNFHDNSGSYIIECFDEDKANIRFLLNKPTSLRHLSESIQEFLPIGVSKVSDRLGNIILQFPIELLYVKTSLREDDQVNAELIWNFKVKQKRELQILTLSESDQLIGNMRIQDDKFNSHILLPHSQGNIQHIFFDKETQLILAISNKAVYLSQLSFNLSVGSPQPRIFNILDSKGNIIGERNRRVQVYSNDQVNTSNINNKNTYNNFIQNRLYEEEKKEQEKTLSFVQYGRNSHDRERALKDIRTLINKYGQGGICLWDPYLTYIDIMETLYFCEFYNAPCRAIGLLDKKTKDISEQMSITEEQGLGIEKYKRNNAINLSKSINNNNFGINLEFRVQYNKYGWKFHDRFIIFPEIDGNNAINSRVEAWSLGTSINSLGKRHHILQKVSHPRNILDAFNELWDKLNHSNCLVWKYPNE
jgi:hypothetical protein